MAFLVVAVVVAMLVGLCAVLGFIIAAPLVWLLNSLGLAVWSWGAVGAATALIGSILLIFMLIRQKRG